MVKALVFSLGVDLDQQLAIVYVVLCVFLAPFMLAGLEWSARVLERLWPVSQADELSQLTNSVEETFFLLSKLEREFNPADATDEHVPHA